MKTSLNKLLPFFCLFFVCFLFFSPIFLNPGKILHGQDFSIIYYWKDFIREELLNFRLPLWNPYDRTGFPWFANPNTATWYPSNLLFIIFPTYFALNLIFFVHILLTLFFSYLFARSLKLSVIPSLCVAVTFGFSGFVPIRIYSGHREIIESLPWIPAFFLFLNSYFNETKIKYLILGGFALGLQLLAGNPTWAIYTMEAAFVFALFASIKRLLFRVTSYIKFVTLGVLISSIQLIPFIELSRLTTRANSFSFEQSVLGSFPLSHLIIFVSPFHFNGNNPLTGPYSGAPNYFELAFFVGFTPLILSLFSLLLLRKVNKYFFAFLIVGVVMFSLALGGYNPFYKILWDLVYFYQKTRFPVRHLILFVFSLSVLCGIGCNVLKRKFLQLMFFALIVAELFWYGENFLIMESPTKYLGNENLFAFLKRDNTQFRYYPVYDLYSGMRISVSEFNTPFKYNISTLKAYDSSILTSYHNFINRIQKTNGYGEVDVPLMDVASKDLNFLNAKYLLTEPGRDLEKDDPARYKKVLTDPTFNLYENKENLPRFFFNPKEDGNVEVEKYLPNEIVLKVNSSKDSFLASSEIYYPGWHATIDDKETGFSLIYNTFRGVDVPSGKHTIKWYFLPYSLLIGAGITTLSVIFCFFLLVRNRSLRPQV